MKNEKKNKEFLTIEEAALMAGISIGAVMFLVDTKKIRIEKIEDESIATYGNINKADFEKLMQAGPIRENKAVAAYNRSYGIIDLSEFIGKRCTACIGEDDNGQDVEVQAIIEGFSADTWYFGEKIWEPIYINVEISLLEDLPDGFYWEDLAEGISLADIYGPRLTEKEKEELEKRNACKQKKAVPAKNKQAKQIYRRWHSRKQKK